MIHASSRIDAQLCMYGTFPQAVGETGLGHSLQDQSLLRRVETRWSNVIGLLEKGTVEGIGLVEDGQGTQSPLPENAFHRHLEAGDEVFQQQRSSLFFVGAVPDDALDPAAGDEQFLRSIRPDDAPAGGHCERLHHAGIANPGNLGLERAMEADRPEARDLHSCGRQGGPCEVLAARDSRCGRWVVRQTRRLRHPARDFGSDVIGGDDGGNRRVPHCREECAHRLLGLAEVDLQSFRRPRDE